MGNESPKPRKSGPAPERLALKGDWQDRLAEALGAPVGKAPPKPKRKAPKKGTKKSSR